MFNKFNSTCLFFLFLAFAGQGLFAPTETLAQIRTWTDSTGNYKIQAKLILVREVGGELQAELLQEDGRRMVIPLSKLSESDRELASKFRIDSLSKPGTSEKRADSKLSDATAPKTGAAVSAMNSVVPADKVPPQPIRVPSNPAGAASGGKTLGKIKFDPATAVQLTREIKRDKSGRAIENPIYTVEVDVAELQTLPPSFRKIATLLNDASKPVDEKRRAIVSFAEEWPVRRQPALIAVLTNCLSHDDKFLRLAALDLLAIHDSDQSLPYILARIDDVSFDVRWRTYELLAHFRDPRVIPELCERLASGDCRKIASLLRIFGATANPWIHPWLKRSELDEKYVLEICRILADTGDSDSVEGLSGLKDHESKLVRRQAAFAIRQIEQRLKTKMLPTTKTQPTAKKSEAIRGGS